MRASGPEPAASGIGGMKLTERAERALRLGGFLRGWIGDDVEDGVPGVVDADEKAGGEGVRRRW